MPSRSRAHARAAAIARAVVPIFAPVLREEELVTAFQEVYAVVRAGLEEYDRDAGRWRRRLDPTQPDEEQADDRV